jgi:hypothetical protein
MTNTFWPIAEFAARGLEPLEREAVLGDLSETGETGWSALRGVLGLVVRRQAPLWRSWPPWVAGIGVALPSGYLLTWVSASISCTYERLFGPHVSRHWWPTGHEGLLLFLCHVFLLIAWSWTAGYVSTSFSRRTAWVTAAFCFIPFFFYDGFDIYPLPRICLLLFVLPLFLGIHHGLRTPQIQPLTALALATVVTGLMAFCWNRGALWILNWGLLWPMLCLVAVTLKSRGKAASRAQLAQS